MRKIALLVFAAALLPACDSGSDSDLPPAPPDDGPQFVRIDHDLPVGPGDSTSPVLAASGDTIHAVWFDDRTGSNRPWYNVSRDGGATWNGADTPMSTAGSLSISNLVMKVDGNVVSVAWQENRGGQTDIFFNGSTDGGLTWLPAEIRLDTDAAGANQSEAPQLYVSGQLVVAAWHDIRDGGSVRINRSTDGGLTWRVADYKANTQPVGSNPPVMAGDGTTIDVIWGESYSDGVSGHLWHSRSTDGGTTFPGPETDIKATSPAADAVGTYALATAGNTVCVMWVQMNINTLSFTTTEIEIYVTRSVDGGAIWPPAPPTIHVASVDNQSSSVVGFAQSPSMVVALFRDPAGTWMTRTDNLGLTWYPPMPPNGSSSLQSVAITARGTDMAVAWTDDSSPLAPNVFARRTKNGAFPVWGPEDTVGQNQPFGGTPGVAVTFAGTRPVVAWTDASGADVNLMMNRRLP